MIRPSALPFVLIVLAACVGDDPGPISGTSGTSGSVGDSGASTGTRSISCDAKSVCTGRNNCCGVGTDWINAKCLEDCAGAYELTCDDATDCGAGLVCCYVSDGGARAKLSYCKASCAGPERQLCKAGSTECRTGGCTPFVAHSPGGLAECQ